MPRNTPSVRALARIPVRPPGGTLARASLLAAVAGFGAPAFAAGVSYSLLARVGDQAPGAPAGVVYDAGAFATGNISFNNQRKVSFRSLLSGAGVAAANDVAIFSGTPGALFMAVREGQAAPGVPGAPSATIATLNGEGAAISGDGALAFRTTIAGPGVTFADEDCLFAGTPGSYTLMARVGGFAPGAPLSTFGSFGAPVINSFHQVCFWGTFASNGDTGLWFGAPGGLSNILRTLDPALEFPPPTALNTFVTTLPGGATTAMINSAGQFVFRTDLVFGVGPANNSVLYGGTPGSYHIVGYESATGTAPGAPPSPSTYTFSVFEDPILNDTGAVAWRSFLTGGGVTAANDFGIYRRIILGVVDKVAREGDAAPGTPAVFASLSELNNCGRPRFNNAYGVAFRAMLSGTGVTAANDFGLWQISDTGALVLAVREGDPVPGSAGVTFATLAAVPPAYNGANRLAFRATIAGTGITAANNDGIWAFNAMNDMVEVARANTTSFETAPGVTRTVTSILNNPLGPGVQDAMATHWNDHCELLIRCTLDNVPALVVADVNNTCKPDVTAQPSNTSATVGSPATFSITASGPRPTIYGITYRWRHNGAAMSDGGGITGTDSASLTISSCRPSDAGAYVCEVTNICGTRASNPATLTVVPCVADTDDGSGSGTPDGGVGIEDLLYYLLQYEAGTIRADVDDGTGTGTPDGGVGIEDLLYFLTRFSSGC